VGESDPDIFFTDRPRELFPGQRNRECLSFFADEEPGLLRGRSPMQCYAEFMRWASLFFLNGFCVFLGGGEDFIVFVLCVCVFWGGGIFSLMSLADMSSFAACPGA
jgi:hypothetical protein